MEHVPVLLKEAIDGLNISEGDTILDETFGGGGHSSLICKAIGLRGRLVALDQDEEAIERAHKQSKIFSQCKFELINVNFRNLDQELSARGVEGLDGALFDLGLSSYQLEESGRGFSFQKDESLQMTFGKNPNNEALIAEEIVNKWDEENIADIIYGYGGEKFARRIARAIVEERSLRPIKTTLDLVAVIKSAAPSFYTRRKIHFATKTFQALRIAVNDELGALREALNKVWLVLNPGARLVVISFHELEDRIVKTFLRERWRDSSASIITKKPVVPSLEEIRQNPRSRSAKLRIGQKI